MKDYHNLPADVKVDLLEQALASAPSPHQIEALEVARANSQRKQISLTAEQHRHAEVEIEKMRVKFEKKLAAAQAQIEAQDEELTAYATELSKFVRVPNEHRVTPLLSEYTYQQAPEYDQFGESIYGAEPPTRLPRFGNQDNDGWVFREERWRSNGEDDTKIWPMYVYKGD